MQKQYLIKIKQTEAMSYKKTNKQKQYLIKERSGRKN